MSACGRSKPRYSFRPWTSPRCVPGAAPDTLQWRVRPGLELDDWWCVWWVAVQIEAMRRQKELMAKMQFAYKAGDHSEVERIRAMLEPDQ